MLQRIQGEPHKECKLTKDIYGLRAMSHKFNTIVARLS